MHVYEVCIPLRTSKLFRPNSRLAPELHSNSELAGIVKFQGRHNHKNLLFEETVLLFSNCDPMAWLTAKLKACILRGIFYEWQS